LIPVLVLALLTVGMFSYAARGKAGSRPAEPKAPAAIRRGKYLNK